MTKLGATTPGGLRFGVCELRKVMPPPTRNCGSTW